MTHVDPVDEPLEPSREHIPPSISRDELVLTRLRDWAARHLLVSSRRFDSLLEIDRNPEQDIVRCQIERTTEERDTEERVVPNTAENYPSREISDIQAFVDPPADLRDASYTYCLKDTARVDNCAACEGEGTRMCQGCGGRGVLVCAHCQGLGRTRQQKLPPGFDLASMAPVEWETVLCHHCSLGRNPCMMCAGRRQLPCEACVGTGTVLAYTAVNIRFSNLAVKHEANARQISRRAVERHWAAAAHRTFADRERAPFSNLTSDADLSFAGGLAEQLRSELRAELSGELERRVTVQKLRIVTAHVPGSFPRSDVVLMGDDLIVVPSIWTLWHRGSIALMSLLVLVTLVLALVL